MATDLPGSLRLPLDPFWTASSSLCRRKKPISPALCLRGRAVKASAPASRRSRAGEAAAAAGPDRPEEEVSGETDTGEEDTGEEDAGEEDAGSGWFWDSGETVAGSVAAATPSASLRLAEGSLDADLLEPTRHPRRAPSFGVVGASPAAAS
mmetsp:Transcript_4298/g.17611  ORF Transcript_4298/g.17611 Transcript_4298/m.17611 type:complete len:151 (+) Transcript_4298:1383-1835(+)